MDTSRIVVCLLFMNEFMMGVMAARRIELASSQQKIIKPMAYRLCTKGRMATRVGTNLKWQTSPFFQILV